MVPVTVSWKEASPAVELVGLVVEIVGPGAALTVKGTRFEMAPPGF